MRKLFLWILLCVSSGLIYAQENVKANFGSALTGKNLIKVNLLSLPLGNLWAGLRAGLCLGLRF